MFGAHSTPRSILIFHGQISPQMTVLIRMECPVPSGRHQSTSMQDIGLDCCLIHFIPHARHHIKQLLDSSYAHTTMLHMDNRSLELPTRNSTPRCSQAPEALTHAQLQRIDTGCWSRSSYVPHHAYNAATRRGTTTEFILKRRTLAVSDVTGAPAYERSTFLLPTSFCNAV